MNIKILGTPASPTDKIMSPATTYVKNKIKKSIPTNGDISNGDSHCVSHATTRFYLPNVKALRIDVLAPPPEICKIHESFSEDDNSTDVKFSVLTPGGYERSAHHEKKKSFVDYFSEKKSVVSKQDSNHIHPCKGINLRANLKRFDSADWVLSNVSEKTDQAQNSSSNRFSESQAMTRPDVAKHIKGSSASTAGAVLARRALGKKSI